MRAAFKDDAKDKDSDSDSKQHKKDKDKDKKSGRNDSKGLVFGSLTSLPKFFFHNSNVRFCPMYSRFGWSKRKVPLSRSGRVIKGRGVFVCIK